MDAIDKAFGTTTKFLFGKELSPLAKYEEWLQARIAKGTRVNSAIGNKTCYLPEYAFFGKIPKARAVSLDNLAQAEMIKLAIGENETLASIKKKSKSMVFVPDYVEGRNLEVTDTTAYLDCVNVHKSFDIFTTKNSAYLFSVMESENLFGCYRVASSKFCMHCYNIVNLSACFEMDLARNCSNSMFCHNVENVHNSLFCFNVKNKNYAIGNVEVGREQFLRVKTIICAQLVGELEKNGQTNFDVYSVI
jgi:hypothetical protein